MYVYIYIYIEREIYRYIYIYISLLPPSLGRRLVLRPAGDETEAVTARTSRVRSDQPADSCDARKLWGRHRVRTRSLAKSWPLRACRR